MRAQRSKPLDLKTVPADRELVIAAAITAERHQLSIFDAMIIEAAAHAGCTEGVDRRPRHRL
jgi:predicted nucleic acid-binding protein